jgi:tetratricopeptide (TPR) repeat protein
LVSDYEDLVKNDPGDPYNRYYLASVYFKEGKLIEAIDQLQNAIKIKADFSYAYNLLGKIYLKQNKFFDAEKSFKQAISYDRYYNHAYLNLARAYKKGGFFRKANAAAKQAIIAGIFDSYSNLPSTSSADYVNNLKKNPDNAIFHNNLGFLYWTDGKTDKAINEFKAAISLDPYQADYLSNLAYCYHDNGQNDKALELIKKYDILKRKPGVKKAHSIKYGEDEIRLDTIFVLPILSIKERSRS